MATFRRASVALAVSLSLADAFAPGVGPSPMLRRARATAAAPVRMAGGLALPDGGAAPFGTQADLQDTVNRAAEGDSFKKKSRAAQGDSFKKKVTLLGSTGSIGTQTLDIIDYLPDRFEVDHQP
ncbi:hypothetical protein T484DRAFT_1805994 [Baffinella frigidus]|nr:hypothetical protein T484DRAFT_1805994 [Cryptophyta sp. CCMP2293]